MNVHSIRVHSGPTVGARWLALLMTLIAACACVNTAADTRARTALNLLADIVDPAYSMAMQGCVDREDYLLREGEAGRASAVDTENRVRATVERCNGIAAQFDRIRTNHEAAAKLVREGKVEEAEQHLEQVRHTWRKLREEVSEWSPAPR